MQAGPYDIFTPSENISTAPLRLIAGNGASYAMRPRTLSEQAPIRR